MTSPTPNPYSRQLADLLLEHDRRLAQLEGSQRAVQLGNSSIEDDFIAAYDALGQARQRIGRQNDGTFAVTYGNGEAPPQLDGFNVSAGQLSLVFQWDGTFIGGAERPKDFARLDIHVSETNGFTYGPTTLVASLFGEGATSVFADSDTKYVRAVAVNNSDVPSVPTDQVTILPLPADQIAVGAIGAEQLAAIIVLATRVLAGDPDAARVEINAGGLEAYNSSGTRTVFIDATDGSITATGTYRTALSGNRIVINEAGVNARTIRFYPSTGTEHAAIYMTDDSDQIVLTGIPDGPGGTAGFLWSGPAQMAMGYGTAGTAILIGVYALDGGLSFMVGGQPNLVMDERVSYATPRCNRFVHVNTSGTEIAGSVVQHRRTTIGADTFPRLSAPTPDASLAIAFGALWAQNVDGSGHRAMHASAFTVESDPESKENITDIDLDPLAVIRGAKVQKFRFKDDSVPEDTTVREGVNVDPLNPEGTKTRRPGHKFPTREKYGVMATDLPASMVGTSKMTGRMEVDLGDQIAMTWAGIDALMDKLEAIEARLAALEAG